MDYIMGVDGGGTKTEAVAYNLKGEDIGKGYSGFGNLILDFDRAAENIVTALRLCRKSMKEPDSEGECLGIFLGVAGIEAGNNTNKLESLVRKEFSCEVWGFHDTVLAHAALFKGSDGIIAISGTGSVCYGEYKGTKIRTGGWGHILGDDGSGYYIALEAFKRMTLEEDSGWIRSTLTSTIMSRLGIQCVNDLKDFVYSASKAEIAAYAPIVAELANASEINAVHILKKAGRELAGMTERLYRRLEINEWIKIGVSGSIFNKVELVRDEFISCIERDLNSVEILTDHTNATMGAYYIYKRTIGKNEK